MGNKKRTKEFEKQIGKFIEQKDCVRIEREFSIGESDIYGILVNQSEKFLQIAEMEEFNFNGQVVIRKDQFDFIRCNEYDKYYKKILVKEGLLKKGIKSKTLKELNTWKNIFSDLRKKGSHVIVECEDLDNPTFVLGQIDEISKKTVSIRNYSPTGKFNEQATKIKFDDITLLKFGDRYSTIFKKYVKPLK